MQNNRSEIIRPVQTIAEIKPRSSKFTTSNHDYKSAALAMYTEFSHASFLNAAKRRDNTLSGQLRREADRLTAHAEALHAEAILPLQYTIVWN